ncbi:MAG: hypothetical protein ABIJ34_01850 [archaeon]
MKKFSLLIFFLLASSATGTLEYEGFLQNGNSLKFDNIIYTTVISSRGDSLLLASAVPISLKSGACQDKLYRRYCFNFSLFDKDIDDYKAYIKIYSLKPEIEIKRTVDENILEPGKSAEFESTIINSGEETAYNLTFFDSFPENTIVESSDLFVGQNYVSWTGNLKQGDSKTFAYKITSLGDFDRSSKASVRYFDGITNKDIGSDTIKLYSSSVLELVISTPKKEYALGETINFTILIKNKGDKSLKIQDFNLYVPENAVIERKSSQLSQSGNTMSWIGSIDSGDNKTFQLFIKSTKTGLGTVSANGDYSYLGQVHLLQEVKTSYEVDVQDIELVSSLDKDNTFAGGDSIRVTLTAKNKNQYSGIKNIKCGVTTTLAGFENFTLGLIPENRTTILLDTIIKLPESTAEVSYPIRFNVSYETEEGKFYSKVLEVAAVSKISPRLILTANTGSESVTELEPVDVSLSLENPSLVDLKNIYVDSIVGPEFTIKGASSAYTDLNKSQRTDLLTFTIIPYMVDYEESFLLNFSATYMLDGTQKEILQTKSLKVVPRKPSMSFVKKLSKTDLYMGEIFDIVYTITNDNDFSVHDIRLVTTSDQSFDTLDLFEKTLGFLGPGESITFEGERLRPKSAADLSVSKSLIFFLDSYGRTFNQSSDTASIHASEDKIEGAAYYLELNTSRVMIVGHIYPMVLKISSKGTFETPIVLENESHSITEKSIYEYFLNFTATGTYILPKKWISYNYQNKEIRAFSNELTINVVNETTIVEPALPEQVIQVNQTIEIKKEEKIGFFARIGRFIRSVFGLK